MSQTPRTTCKGGGWGWGVRCGQHGWCGTALTPSKPRLLSQSAPPALTMGGGNHTRRPRALAFETRHFPPKCRITPRTESAHDKHGARPSMASSTRFTRRQQQQCEQTHPKNHLILHGTGHCQEGPRHRLHGVTDQQSW